MNTPSTQPALPAVIDINCDMGESFGAYTIGCDESIMPFVSSVNIACGFHGGDPSVMRATVERAAEHGVAIGAHPGLQDMVGFGRREMAINAEQVFDIVLYQIGSLEGFLRRSGVHMTHVKPHGALYTMAARNDTRGTELSEAIVQAIHTFAPQLVLVGPPNSSLVRSGERQGLRVALEGFCDRAYQANGSLLPRSHPMAVYGAGLMTPDEGVQRASKQAVSIATEQTATTLDGESVPVQVHTLCIHGDTPHAANIATAVRNALAEAGVMVCSMASVLAQRGAIVLFLTLSTLMIVSVQAQQRLQPASQAVFWQRVALEDFMDTTGAAGDSALPVNPTDHQPSARVRLQPPSAVLVRLATDDGFLFLEAGRERFRAYTLSSVLSSAYRAPLLSDDRIVVGYDGLTYVYGTRTLSRLRDSVLSGAPASSNDVLPRLRVLRNDILTLPPSRRWYPFNTLVSRFLLPPLSAGRGGAASSDTELPRDSLQSLIIFSNDTTERMLRPSLVHQSSNSGISWSMSAASGLPDAVGFVRAAVSVEKGFTTATAQAALQREVLYCADDVGKRPALYRSFSGGASWTELASIGRYPRYWGLNSSTGTLFAASLSAAGLTLLRSTDRGESWRLIEGLSVHRARQTHEASPGAVSFLSSPRALFVNIRRVGLFRSTDDGITFVRVTPALPSSAGEALPVIPSAGNGIADVFSVVQSPDGSLYALSVDAVWFSANDGDAWRLLSEGLPSKSEAQGEFAVLSLAFDRFNHDVVPYLLTTRGIYRLQPRIGTRVDGAEQAVLQQQSSKKSATTGTNSSSVQSLLLPTITMIRPNPALATDVLTVQYCWGERALHALRLHPYELRSLRVVLVDVLGRTVLEQPIDGSHQYVQGEQNISRNLGQNTEKSYKDDTDCSTASILRHNLPAGVYWCFLQSSSAQLSAAINRYAVMVVIAR